MSILPDWFTWTWFEDAVSFKDLMVAAIGSLAGAWGGAIAAQRIAEKSKHEDFVRAEIGRVRAAIELAFSTMNGALVMKKQHVKELKETYDRDYQRVHEHQAAKARGELARDAVLDLGEMKLMRMDQLRVPVERLEKLILEDLQVRGRPRPMMVSLRQAVETVNLSIEMQNNILSTSRKMPTHEQVATLFALPIKGVTDEMFKTSIDQMYLRLDDCIWFSNTIMEDVARYGQSVEPTRFLRAKRYRIFTPRIDAAAKELFPPDTAYNDWIRNFQRLVAPTKGRRLRKFLYMLRHDFRAINYWLGWRPRGKDQWRRW